MKHGFAFRKFTILLFLFYTQDFRHNLSITVPTCYSACLGPFSLRVLLIFSYVFHFVFRLYICNSTLCLHSSFGLLCTQFYRPEKSFHRLHVAFLPLVSTVNNSCGSTFFIPESCRLCFLKSGSFTPQSWQKFSNVIFIFPLQFLRNFSSEITEILYLLINLILYKYFFFQKIHSQETSMCFLPDI